MTWDRRYVALLAAAGALFSGSFTSAPTTTAEIVHHEVTADAATASLQHLTVAATVTPSAVVR